jgi:CRP-like cAMP-binding protein
MDLFSRFFSWLDVHRLLREGQGGENPGSQDSLRLTVWWGRRKVDFAIGDSARTDEIPATPATDEQNPPPGDRDDTGPVPLPPAFTDHTKAPTGSLEAAQTDGEKAASSRQHSTAFWDDLEPTEREAIRALAFLRTFAAGAQIMEEGERADHVMVILGGRVEVRVEENGTERVLAVRGVGQLVGERGALEVSVRSANVVAVDMVWALVVHTKDFATFLTAHPRVMEIVQKQFDQRGLENPAGAAPSAGRPHDPPTRNADGTATVRGEAVQGNRGRHSRRHSRQLKGENCTVILTDVVKFGSRTRTDGDRLVIREALFSMTHTALQNLPDTWSWDDRGDGLLTVVPPSVPTALVLRHLHKELPSALNEHNSAHEDSARIQLRVAVNVGPVATDVVGVSGEAIIVTARLVEAPQFKEAMETSQVSLGIIASAFIYENVIRHDLGLTGYSPVQVDVKESSFPAWMNLFGPPDEASREGPGWRPGHLIRI